jgi:hypothetical protein
MIDQRRAQFAILEMERGHGRREIVPEHARGKIRLKGWPSRALPRLFQHGQRPKIVA